MKIKAEDSLTAREMLLKWGIFALQKQAGYTPDVMPTEPDAPIGSVLATDNQYSSYTLIVHILIRYFDVPIEDMLGSVMLQDEVEAMSDNIWDAVVKQPKGFIRDLYYKWYNLPALSRDMTIEEKRIADAIEERLKEDIYLERDGKVRCHFTGVISPITPEMKARKKQVERMKQADMNKAYMSGD
jgi:hypothetical protein